MTNTRPPSRNRHAQSRNEVEAAERVADAVAQKTSDGPLAVPEIHDRARALIY